LHCHAAAAVGQKQQVGENTRVMIIYVVFFHEMGARGGHFNANTWSCGANNLISGTNRYKTTPSCNYRSKSFSSPIGFDKLVQKYAKL
jgi:hypothetical protein